MTSSFILKTEPHAVQGDAYVVVTDHRDDAYLDPLRRLARHHGGTLVQVDDLGGLSNRPTFEAMRNRLREAKVRYLAVAPRQESFRENMLLALWEVLASLDADPQLDALPGLLLAPDAKSLSELVDRSLAYRPIASRTVRPFIISQAGDNTPDGTRSIQKLAMLRAMFEAQGHKAPGLIVRATRDADAPGLEGADLWQAQAAARNRPLTTLPDPAARAFDDASLVLMFGHGTPGMTCSLSVDAFDRRQFADKVVLCGSCMSAAPVASDFRRMEVGPDGSKIINDRKRFLMEAVERGALVSYGHMRLNAGFPHLYAVLESLLAGQTVGESYQRLIDGLLNWSQLDPGALVLTKEDADNPRAVNRRNLLLYVLIGDPALRAVSPPRDEASASRH